IYYNCMFVRRDLQKLGRGIYLFINAIRLQAKAEIPKGIWRVNFNNSSMLRFVKKHMIPYTNSLEEVSCSSKLLVDI
ncbi:MAG: GNAT family N-acetyltransferase, partial [Waterburya sp.]